MVQTASSGSVLAQFQPEPVFLPEFFSFGLFYGL
jgi:hypothetical protein